MRLQVLVSKGFPVKFESRAKGNCLAELNEFLRLKVDFRSMLFSGKRKSHVFLFLSSSSCEKTGLVKKKEE